MERYCGAREEKLSHLDKTLRAVVNRLERSHGVITRVDIRCYWRRLTDKEDIPRGKIQETKPAAPTGYYGKLSFATAECKESRAVGVSDPQWTRITSPFGHR
jgi:hypothetical protein